ncbi:unnamed protein product [Cunninghamella blakesleeana]
MSNTRNEAPGIHKSSYNLPTSINEKLRWGYKILQKLAEGKIFYINCLWEKEIFEISVSTLRNLSSKPTDCVTLMLDYILLLSMSN